MSNIELNIVAVSNFSALEGELARLRAQIEQTKLAMKSVNATATSGQIHGISAAFGDAMAASGKFTGTTVKLSSAAEQLGVRIARNKTTFNDFKQALFGLNKETNLYNQLGKRQLAMQQSIVQNLGEGRAKVWTPHIADLKAAGAEAYAYQQRLMAANATLKQASVSMINWGKNMQWTGRQLTYGITAPIMLLGAGTAKLFYDVNQNLTRLARVYGVGMESASEATIAKIKSDILGLSNELSKSLGIAASETTDIAAELAAAGQTGSQLIEDTKQAARIVVLGETDKQEAIKATIALQTAYQLNTQELTDSVNFFNAAQAATSTSMADLVEAVPRVGPVIKGLGGSYKDMVAILTAMREGGVPAAEAANAIKTSLGRLINPTKEASDTLKGFGIDIENIVNSNEGNLVGMLTELQQQLDGLSSLDRQRAISELFGKFQFARMTSLMDNFNKAGTQSAKVVDMMGLSSQELGQIAAEQTKKIQESASGSFKIAIESLKTSLIPIGEMFLEVFTKIVEAIRPLIDWFNSLGDSTKGFIKFLLMGAAAIGPIVMIGGLLGNLIGILFRGAVNAKIFFGAIFRLQNPFKALTSQYVNLTEDSIAAENATKIMSKAMLDAAGNTDVATEAINRQIAALKQLIANMGLLGGMNEGSVANVAARRTAAAMAATHGIVLAEPRGVGSLELSHLDPRGTPGGIAYFEGATLASSQGSKQQVTSNVPQYILPSNSPESRKALYDYLMTKSTEKGHSAEGIIPANAAKVTDSATTLAQQVNQNARAMAIGQTAGADYYTKFHALSDNPQAQREYVEKYLSQPHVQKVHQRIIAELTRAYVTEFKATGGDFRKAVDAYKSTARTYLEKNVVGPIVTAANEVMKRPGKNGPLTPMSYLKNLEEQFATDLRSPTPKQAGIRAGEAKVNSALMFAAALDTQESIDAVQSQILTESQKQYTLSKELSAIEDVLLNAEKEEIRLVESTNALRQKINDLLEGRTAAESQAFKAKQFKTVAEGDIRKFDSTTGKATWFRADGQAYSKTTNSVREKEFLAYTERELAMSNQQLETQNQELKAVRELASKQEIELTNAQEAAMNKFNAAMDQAGLNQEERTRMLNSMTMDQIAATKKIIPVIQEEQVVKWNLISATNELIDSILAEAGAHQVATTETKKISLKQRMNNIAGKAGGALMAAGMLSTFAMNGENQNKAMSTATDIAGGVTMGAGAGMMFGGPWGALAGAALGGAAAAAQAYQRNQQEVNDKLIAYGEALGGSSLVLDKFASEMGMMKPTEKLTAALGKIASPDKVVKEGGQLLNTEAGQQLLTAAKQYSGADLQNMLLSQLRQLTLMEIFTPDQAKTVAQTLAIQLGDPMLGKSLVDGINSILDSNGELIKSRIAELFVGTIGTPDLTTMPQKPVLTSGVQNQSYSVDAQYAADLKKWAQGNVPVMASSIDKLREAEAMLTNEFMAGQITFEEYSKQLDMIRQQNIQVADSMQSLVDSGVDVGAMLKDIADKAGRGEDYVKIEQLANSLTELVTPGRSGGRFIVQLQMAAAYGDITPGEVQAFYDLIQDPQQQANVQAIFSVSGAEENATQILKLLNMGVSSDYIMNITTKYKEIGKPLDTVYASIAAIAGLPENVQKGIMIQVQNDPKAMDDLISNYEHITALPNTKKDITAEVFGNDKLITLRDHWKEFMALPDQERKVAMITTIMGYEYNFPTQEIPMPKAPTQINMPDVQSMVDAATSSKDGGSGGGSSGQSPEEKALDHQIKQEEKLIENINKEREARQKVLDVQKQALDFALREQDLKNQIAIARASGNTAQAALLQGQLDAARAENSQSLAEKARQEAEDKKIKAAEKRKADLEKQKQKLSQDSSSGGGGGSSSGDAAAQKLANRLEFLNNELQAALQGNDRLLDQINQRGAKAFWSYGPIKRYKQEAVAAGVPLKVVNQQLEAIYDTTMNTGFKEIPFYKSLSNDLKDIGIQGTSLEKILPNIFGILKTPGISKSEAMAKVEEQFNSVIGDAEEAHQKMLKFFSGDTNAGQLFNDLDKLQGKVKELVDNESLTKDHAKTVSQEMAKGLQQGLTGNQILDNIGKAIYDSTLNKGLKQGLDPNVAKALAEGMSDSVKTTVKTNFDGFFQEIKFVDTVDDTALPDWLKNKLNTPGMRDALDIGVTHTVAGPAVQQVSGNVTVSGNVSISNLPVVGNAVQVRSLNAAGGLMRFGTGGMIYGPGGPTADLIPTMLSNGEYVIRAASVKKYGPAFLDMINRGVLPSSKYPSMLSGLRMSGGGMPSMNYAEGGLANNSKIEYNINIDVAGTNASAEEIASTVMSAIQRRDRMNGTRIRI